MPNLVPVERIENKIYFIRSRKVMLDRDLAQLYGVSTEMFKAKVKRHIDRFPEDFMFQLTQDELDDLKRQEPALSHLEISKKPCVFAEAGLLMLSSVLKSEKAVQVNIGIIRSLFGSHRLFLAR